MQAKSEHSPALETRTTVYDAIQNDILATVSEADFATLADPALTALEAHVAKYFQLVRYTKQLFQEQTDPVSEVSESIPEPEKAAEVPEPPVPPMPVAPLPAEPVAAVMPTEPEAMPDVPAAVASPPVEEPVKKAGRGKKKQIRAPRNRLNYMVVRYDEQARYHYLEASVNGTRLRYDDLPFTKVLSEGDRFPLRVQEGDIVDFAWDGDRVDQGTIIYKHPVPQKTPVAVVEKPVVAPAVQTPIPPQAKKEAKEKAIPAVLAKKRVCLVGASHSHTAFKAMVAERGGELLTLTGDEPRTTQLKTIQKADACILALSGISHRAANQAVKTAKESGIPFRTFQGFGRSTFIETVKLALAVS